jgi:toxin ParE1/3/4
MRILQDSAVLEELILLAGYISDDNEEAAHRFLDACDATFRFLAENRHAGARKAFSNPELQEVRMWRVKGFEKHLIFYKPLEDGVRILHVVHSARDWRGLFDDEAR